MSKTSLERLAYISDWQRKNKEKVNAKNARWRAANLEKDRKIKRLSAAKNRKKHTTYIRERRRNNIQFKLQGLLRHRLFNALNGQAKVGSALQELGCSIHEFKTYIESKFKPGMTWENLGKTNKNWQIDHIRPLFSFDLTDINHLKQACHYTNLQPIWFTDHIEKSKEEKRMFERLK